MLEPVVHVSCPYCGQVVDVIVDVSAGTQSYVEDCRVCCQPMDVTVEVNSQGDYHVDVARTDA